MPFGTKAPKLCPAEPERLTWMVPSGRPSLRYRLVTSWPSMVPTVRLVLRISTSISTGWPDSRAGAAWRISSLSSAFSRPWSCEPVQRRSCSKVEVGWWRMGERSRPLAFQCSTAGRVSRHSTWPMASASERKPRAARCSRTSSAMNSKNVSTNSGCPVKRARSSGFWVATPTGQVSRWQTRIMMQPDTTSGAVAKPYSSAPSRAATMTSRPVFIWPSVCTTMRSRKPLRSSVCWVSARPSSQGAPACFNELSGLAPVPPS